MSFDTEYTPETLPVLPLRGLVAFPETLIHFDVGRLISMKALEASMKGSQKIFLTAQCDIRTDVPKAEDLYRVGTVCNIKQILRLPGDNIRVLVQGTHRAFVEDFYEEEECLYASVERLETNPGHSSAKRIDALIRTLQESFEEYAVRMEKVTKKVVLSKLIKKSLGVSTATINI